MTYYLDTHVLIWLYKGKLKKLSANAREIIETHACKISPMSMLELKMLNEIGRLVTPAEQLINELTNQFDMQVANTSFYNIAQEACSINWTRDPFDRIISAQTANDNANLLTKDKQIRDHFENAVW